MEKAAREPVEEAGGKATRRSRKRRRTESTQNLNPKTNGAYLWNARHP